MGDDGTCSSAGSAQSVSSAPVDLPATATELTHPQSTTIDSTAGRLMTPAAEHLGRYRYDIASDSWWWSDELYRMYGFAPGEVVPTGALILAHTHPEDFEPAAALLSTVVAHAGQFSLRHRMIDTNNRIHTVMSVGEAATDTEGTVTGLVGFVSDLTHSERLAVAHAVDRAVAEFLEHRSLIEQAKGVLRGEFGCDADEAFELIKWRSQHTNIKVYEVASHLLDSLTRPSKEVRSKVLDGFDAQLKATRAKRQPAQQRCT